MTGATSYLGHGTTLKSWLLTKDHKRIGVMFLIATTIALLVGGVFALLLRTEHLTPEPTLVGPHGYNRLFTLHGVIMVWFFMIPAIPSGFGNFLVPLQIGAHDVAFPRLNLASFYIYLLGAFVLLGGLFYGGADTGWTFYVPYSAETPTAVVPLLLGVFILGWSSIITGLNLIVTMHTMRAKGLRWMQMPLFSWAIYGTSVIQVLATPVLGMVLLLVTLEHTLEWGIFDPRHGGDPILYQHLFWFYSHPAVYIMVLPALGVISEVVCAFTRKNPLSYRALVWSTLGIAFFSFLTWGHHMFTSGMSVFASGTFGVLSMFVAIFSAIKVFTWTGTMYRGSVSLKTPLLYVLAFIFLFVFGGMTGVAVATTSLDVHWHDTYFVVAHFHFIMVGGVTTAFLAALHYWWPKLTGRMYPEGWAMVAAVLVFLGFNLAFVPQFLMGNAGMPRRYYFYPEEMQALHVLATGGAWMLGLAFVAVLIYLLWSLRTGARASANPWHSASFEWRTPSPPPHYNFDGTPRFERGAYDYTRVEPPDRPVSLP